MPPPNKGAAPSKVIQSSADARKASPPMVARLAGKVMLLRLPQLLKAL